MEEHRELAAEMHSTLNDDNKSSSKICVRLGGCYYLALGITELGVLFSRPLSWPY